ncbi:MAG: hypothetical protein SWH61_11285 [Thermodesulfobacteriota bacterium]|nr:hypothetical protein [Thermodesulfobacteriota bacterium]
MITQRPVDTLPEKAFQAFTRLQHINQSLSACKGLGKIVIQQQAQARSVRLAWLCKLPDKMRLEALTPTGHSVLTLSLDGRYVYILPHTTGGELQKKRMRRLNLKHVIDIPVPSDDILQLLTGRIPIRDFDTAKLVSGQNSGHTLRLARGLTGIVQTICFDESYTHPTRVTYHSGFWHKTAYTVTFNDFKIMDGFEIPATITMTADDLTATFSIRRYWANPEIPDDRFVIIDPRGKKDGNPPE